MEEVTEIPKDDLENFKSQVGEWLEIDSKIKDLEKDIRELKKKKKNKVLEPQITDFMVTYNISDLNTQNGKVRCNKRNTKKCLNRTNIRDNLSKVMTDSIQLDQAMSLILNNREVITSYKLTKPKN